MLANGFSLVAVSSCKGLLLVCFGLEEKRFLKKPWDSTGVESVLFSTAGFFTISVDLKKFENYFYLFLQPVSPLQPMPGLCLLILQPV